MPDAELGGSLLNRRASSPRDDRDLTARSLPHPDGRAIPDEETLGLGAVIVEQDGPVREHAVDVEAEKSDLGGIGRRHAHMLPLAGLKIGATVFRAWADSGRDAESGDSGSERTGREVRRRSATIERSPGRLAGACSRQAWTSSSASTGRSGASSGAARPALASSISVEPYRPVSCDRSSRPEGRHRCGHRYAHGGLLRGEESGRSLDPWLSLTESAGLTEVDQGRLRPWPTRMFPGLRSAWA